MRLAKHPRPATPLTRQLSRKTRHLTLWAGFALLFAAGSLYLLLPMLPNYAVTLQQRYWVALALSAGGLCFVALYRLVLRRTRLWGAFNTWEHELAHALAAWSVGGTVHAITGSSRGGHVVWTGGAGQWWVALAPYWLPTLPLAWLLVWRGFFPSAVSSNIGLAILGFCLAWHALATWQELHLRQTDFEVTGLAFAGAFILAFNGLAIVGFLSYIARASF